MVEAGEGVVAPLGRGGRALGLVVDLQDHAQAIGFAAHDHTPNLVHPALAPRPAGDNIGAR